MLRLLAIFLIALVVCISDANAAAIKTADVPTFKLRAKIVSAPPQPGIKIPRHTFRLGKQSQVAEDGEWTEWIEFGLPEAHAALKAYPNLYMHSFPVVTRLTVDRAADPTRIEAELQFDETKQVVPLKGELFGPALGILIWRADDKKPLAGTMADYNRIAYWSVLKDVSLHPAQRPKHLPVVDRFIGGDDDRIDWREGIAALAAAGFNAIQVPATASHRAMLLEGGVTRTAGAVYSPPGYAFPDPLAGGKAPEPLDQWAKKIAAPYLAAGFASTDMAWFGLADEPGWYYPQTFSLTDSPAAMERFHNYLKAQGLKPEQLGGTSWDAIKPIGRSAAKDLPSKRLFYWTARFFPADSAQYSADTTRALEKAFYPGIPLATNFNFFAGRSYVPGPVANNRDKTSPDAAMGGHDWLEFGRLRGCTTLWTEDWFGDAGAPQWSFYCAKLASAARKSGVNFGGYVVPRASGDRQAGLLQKMMAIVGSGGKAINTFIFGPEYNFPGNCYSQRPQLLAKVAEGNAMIADAEELVWPGHRQQAQVAILSSRSAQMWDLKDQTIAKGISDATNTGMNRATVDYMAEQADLYLALQHANIPADFVEEEDSSPAGLAGYRVLYVTEPNIPEEFQRGLIEWVKAGGILVTSPGAGASDRFDEPCSILAEAFALHESALVRTPIAKLADLKPAGSLNDAAGPITPIGPRSVLTTDKAHALAAWDDGSPAIVNIAIGKGRVIHFGFFPGISYAASTTTKQDGMATGFSESLREMITRPAKDAGVERAVTPSIALVETPVLISEQGAAITVLNWTGQSISDLKLQLKLPFKPKRMHAVRAGDLKLENGAVHLPVDAVDVIMAWKE